MVNLLKRCVVVVFSATCLIAGPSETPLADAAEEMDRAGIRALLEAGEDVNTPQVDGMTALLWAVHHDGFDTAKLLVDAGADVSAMNRYGVSPLSVACTNGNTAMVELLLEAGADPNTSLPGGETVLLTAARTGKVGPVKALIARGAKVDGTEPRFGQTPVMWAAADGNAAVVEALIEAGADFNRRLDSGFTPLLFAVREGETEVVHTLLAAGADINENITPRKAPRKGLRTGGNALLLAIENGHFGLAAELLKSGAKPDGGETGFTELHAISWVRRTPIGDDHDPVPPGSGNLTSLELVRELVAHGAKVNARTTKNVRGLSRLNNLGGTPYLLAARTADIALMQTLVELGADPLLRSADNSTPLMAAAGLGTVSPGEDPGTESEVLEAVEFALELGDDINVVNNDGDTAMHGAAYKNAPLVVKYLADHGADIARWNRPNKHGWTPLIIAEGHRFGNYKPSPVTVEAIHEVMQSAGVTIPPPTPRVLGNNSDYVKKN
jgi:uncharacterized protein